MNPLHTRLIATGFAACLALPAGSQDAAAAARSPFVGLRFEKLVSQSRMPDQATKVSHGATRYEWDLRMPGDFSLENDPARPACKVTIIVSSRGFVTSMKTELSSAAAEAYAGVGAFGCLCAANFGIKRIVRNACMSNPPFLTMVVDRTVGRRESMRPPRD